MRKMRKHKQLESDFVKKPKNMKLKLLGGLTALITSIGINYFTHFSGYIRSGIKAGEYPIYPIRKEVMILMDYQRKCSDELFSPWVVVPGSVIWRYNKFPEVGDPPGTYELKPLQKKRDLRLI